jgi:hypothetical protein
MLNMTKKVATIGSAVFLSIMLVWNYVGNIKLCTHDGLRSYDCGILLESIEMAFLPLAVSFFFFSLLTLRLPDTVFREWWTFARWWIPVLLLTSFLVDWSISSRLGGFMDASLELFLIWIAYGIFVVVSLFRIVKAWRAEKR